MDFLSQQELELKTPHFPSHHSAHYNTTPVQVQPQLLRSVVPNLESSEVLGLKLLEVSTPSYADQDFWEL